MIVRLPAAWSSVWRLLVSAALVLVLALALAAAASGCNTDSGDDDGAIRDIEGDAAGECSDLADNDQDGLFDCADPDCAGAPDCTGDDDTTAGDDDDTSAGDDDDTSAGDDDDTSTGDDDDSGETYTYVSPELWMMVAIEAENTSDLLKNLENVVGYVRIIFWDPDPAWVDPTSISLLGEVNPDVRMMDADGDGVDEMTGAIDIFSGGGADGLATIGVFGTTSNLGVEVSVSVVGYDFFGNLVFEETDSGRYVLSADNPPQVAIGPIETPVLNPPCDDGLDNDGDGWVDGDDSDCAAPGLPLELGLGAPTCNDGLDNDGDGDIDADDAGCSSGADLSEETSCDDGVDDDGDSWIDSADPDCTGSPGFEAGFGSGACNDGVDNDEDGMADFFDPECVDAGSGED